MTGQLQAILDKMKAGLRSDLEEAKAELVSLGTDGPPKHIRAMEALQAEIEEQISKVEEIIETL